MQPFHPYTKQTAGARTHSKGRNEYSGRKFDAKGHDGENSFDEHGYKDRLYNRPYLFGIADIQDAYTGVMGTFSSATFRKELVDHFCATHTGVGIEKAKDSSHERDLIVVRQPTLWGDNTD